MSDLSVKDIEIAKLIKLRWKNEEIAAKLGCSSKTIQRRRTSPEVQAFLADIRQNTEDKLKTHILEMSGAIDATMVEVIWDFNKAARKLNEIVEDPEAKHSDRIKAIALLNEQYEIKRPESDLPKDDGPLVYKAKWMDKQPN